MEVLKKQNNFARRLLISSRLTSELQFAFTYSESNLVRMLTIMAVLFPLFYVFERAYDPTYDTLWLRILLGSSSCLACIAISPQLNRVGRAYLLFGLSCLCLPWLFAMFMLLNAATTPVGDTLHFAYPASYLAAIGIFSIMFQGLVLVGLSTVIAFSLGIASIPIFVSSANWEEIWQTVYSLAPFMLITIALAGLVNRNKKHVTRTFTEQGRDLGTQIAERLLQPLDSIADVTRDESGSYADFIRDNQAELRNRFSQRQIELLDSSMTDISHECRRARTTADAFLVNTDLTEPNAQGRFESFALESLIDETITQYPYSSEQQAERVVRGSTHDFSIYGPRTHVKHILINLIKNALYYIEDSRKDGAVIEISTLPGETLFEAGRIVVLDTGPGIPIENQSRVFDRFFSTTPSGSGVGLGFAKSTMEALGGRIELTSLEGQFTRFTLVFARD